MNNNKQNYQLVARMQGSRLLLNAALRDELARHYDRRIAQIARRERDRNRRAHRLALECERKGDFLLQTGKAAAALRAYLDAAVWALDGEYYDWDRTQLPAYRLYLRSVELLDKIERCAASDPRLRQLIAGDRMLDLLKSDHAEWEAIYGDY